MTLIALTLLLAIFTLPIGLVLLVRLLQPAPRPNYRRRARVMRPQPNRGLDRDNENVREEILQLWAKLKNPTSSYVAYLFNRRHARERATIAQQTVLRIVKLNQKRLSEMRKAVAKRPPSHVPWQLVWSADLTFRRDADGKVHRIFSIVENYSRACLVLQVIPEKSATLMLRCLCDAVDRYGRPSKLRTDNEAPFLSRVFRLGLWCLGIQHDRTDPYAAYQNSRVERFFGTLKRYLRQWPEAMNNLPMHLAEFRTWYNFVRPHRSLYGRAPAEVWLGLDLFEATPTQEAWFEAWDGHLAGPLFHPIQSLSLPIRDRAPSQSFRRWSQDDDRLLWKHRNLPPAELQAQLPHRSFVALTARLSALRKLRRYRGVVPWTPSDIEVLKSVYPTASSAALRRALPNHSPESIAAKARAIGIRRERSGRGDTRNILLAEPFSQAEISVDLEHCYSVPAAKAFFEAVSREAKVPATLVVELCGRFPTLTITANGAEIAFPFAAMSYVRRKRGRRSFKIMRAIQRPTFRINNGRVRISAYTMLGASPISLGVAEWAQALENRICPVLSEIKDDASVAAKAPTRHTASGAPVADRSCVMGEYAARDIGQLVEKIRQAARRVGKRPLKVESRPEAA